MLDGVAGQLGVLREQLTQRGHPMPPRSVPVRISSNHVGESSHPWTLEEVAMSKRARKRRDRSKKGANHGKKPNT
jgi:hypothetical protein